MSNLTIKPTSDKLAEAHFGLREKIHELWDAIDAAAPHPETIFHYTSAEALQSIVDNRMLWASEALCMNDPTEGIHAGRLIADRLRERHTDVPEHLIRLFSDEMVADILDNQAFVVSFCAGGDLLNQWRAYGLDGRGYAIGFNVERLLNGAAEGRLVPVSYDQAELEALLHAIIDFGVAEITRTVFCKDDFDRYWRFVGNYLLQSVMRFKNPAFREEREWRLVYFPSGNIRFRVAGGRMVPYYEVRFSLEAIQVVRLGPKCGDRDARVLKNYLTSACGQGTPSVENSIIPMA